MTKYDIIRMAIDSWLYSGDPSMVSSGSLLVTRLERFASLIAAVEREACADILDRNADRCDPCSIAFDVLDSNAKAIRARGNK